jgi:hypothetical protein
MIGAGAKTARIQPRSSSLNVFWAASPRQTASVLSDIRYMAVRLPGWVFPVRSAGRHAAPTHGRLVLSRHAPR